jgi:RNA-directed DNA polymerase
VERRGCSNGKLTRKKESRLDKTTDNRDGYEPEEGIPESLSFLRWRLWCKAKQEPDFKFYTLYDRIYRLDTVETAYMLVKRNGGAPGVDGVDFDMIERREGGVAGFIGEIRLELKKRTYQPQAVRRVYIAKIDGSKRPLGIPTIKDRVVQMAVNLILEPIFEADFQDCSYGFRKKRNTHQAVRAIQRNLQDGRREIYDMDLEKYFDSIDHKRLKTYLMRRVVDGGVLRLIKMWLQSRVRESDGTEHTPKQGTPQGGVISPLLANIYLNELDRAFEQDKDSPKIFANARLIRYADDMVVMARYMGQGVRAWVKGRIEGVLGVRINTKKTKLVRMDYAGDELTFLGFTLRYDKDLYGRDKRYLNTVPAKKAENRLREKIRMITKSDNKQTLAELMKKISIVVRGWKSYFSLGYNRKSFKDIDWYVTERIKKFLEHRSQRKCTPLKSGESLYSGIRRLGYA